MDPSYINGNVRARCPDCGGSVTTFECRDASREFGSVIIDSPLHKFEGRTFDRILFILTRCAGCGRGGLAKIHDTGGVRDGVLECFFPTSIERLPIPENVPREIAAEFYEAEACASLGTRRAASALLRSTLEKTLKANGYQDRTLMSNIDAAADDGIITDARRKRAHEDVRVLGNDVLHEEWREVDESEVAAAHHYVQRILEDFYDDRESVEAILVAKQRIVR